MKMLMHAGKYKNLYEKQNVYSVGQLESLWTRTTVIKSADH